MTTIKCTACLHANPSSPWQGPVSVSCGAPVRGSAETEAPTGPHVRALQRLPVPGQSEELFDLISRLTAGLE